MAVPSHRFDPASLQLRRLAPGENEEASRFYREAGYPVPIMAHDRVWGVWVDGILAACVALCEEEDVWVLRGPEVHFEYRRHGLGRALIEQVRPELDGHTCYCVAYSFLMPLYAALGFGACPAADEPEFLTRRVRELREAGWDVVVLRRAP